MSVTRKFLPGALALGASLALVAMSGRGAAAGARMAVAASPLAQDDEEITLAVQPLLEGWFEPGRWVALDVNLENHGADRNVEIRAGGTVVDLELPSGSKKTVPVYVLPQFSQTIRVEVFEGGTVLARRNVSLRRTEGRVPVVVLADDPRRLNGLEGLLPPGISDMALIKTTPDALPRNALAMASIDAVVLDGADLTQADPEQVEVLRQWVALGGLMIVTGGDGAAAAYDSLPADMALARVGRTQVVGNLDGLDGFLGQAPRGEATINILEPLPGTKVAAEQGGLPVIVFNTYGEGSVVGLAVDPGAKPFAGWPDIDVLWRGLSIDSRGTVMGMPPPEPGGIGQALLAVENGTLPPMGALAALMLGYVAAVGPLNYGLLRWRRRMDMAWITIPVITVMASGVTYLVGAHIHGVALRTGQASAVRVVPEAHLAYVLTVVSVFSPASRSYDITVDDGLVRPVANPGVRGRTSRGFAALQGARPGIRSMHIDQWSATTFAVDAVVPWPEAEARDSSGPWGPMRNPVGRDLESVAILTSERGELVGYLEAGATFEVPEPRGSARRRAPLPNSESYGEFGTYVSLLNSALGPYGTRVAMMAPPPVAMAPPPGFGNPAPNAAPLGGVPPRSIEVRPALPNRALVYGWDHKPMRDVKILGRSARHKAVSLYEVLVLP
ncbi:MAG: hypothetical protein ACE5EL_00480 [Anaerolineae bacterium]